MLRKLAELTGGPAIYGKRKHVADLISSNCREINQGDEWNFLSLEKKHLCALIKKDKQPPLPGFSLLEAVLNHTGLYYCIHSIFLNLCVQRPKSQ